MFASLKKVVNKVLKPSKPTQNQNHQHIEKSSNEIKEKSDKNIQEDHTQNQQLIYDLNHSKPHQNELFHKIMQYSSECASAWNSLKNTLVIAHFGIMIAQFEEGKISSLWMINTKFIVSAICFLNQSYELIIGAEDGQISILTLGADNPNQKYWTWQQTIKKANTLSIRIILANKSDELIFFSYKQEGNIQIWSKQIGQNKWKFSQALTSQYMVEQISLSKTGNYLISLEECQISQIIIYKQSTDELWRRCQKIMIGRATIIKKTFAFFLNTKIAVWKNYKIQIFKLSKDNMLFIKQYEAYFPNISPYSVTFNQALSLLLIVHSLPSRVSIIKFSQKNFSIQRCYWINTQIENAVAITDDGKFLITIKGNKGEKMQGIDFRSQLFFNVINILDEKHPDIIKDI